MPFDSSSGERVGQEHQAYHFPANHYEVLGVDHSASEEEIKKAYRRLLIEGLHEDKISAMPEGDDKRVAQMKLEAAKEALKVLGNPRLRMDYDALIDKGGEQRERQNEEDEQGYEKRKEWFELAKAKLELAQSKEEMIYAINRFNSNFNGSPDPNERALFDLVALVSVPEGDYVVRRVSNIWNGGKDEEMFYDELPPFKIGQQVKVSRSSGEIETGWNIVDFIIKDTQNGPVRYLKVMKIDGNNELTKTISAKELRKLNLG